MFYDRYKEDRAAIGRRLSEETGGALVPPYDHPDVIAGQGTAAMELIEEVGPLDMLVTPLGGGGLLAGTTLAAKALSPGAAVIGVEPEAGNDGQQSLAKGEVVTIPIPKSIADGALTPSLGQHNFPIIRAGVEKIVTASDAELVTALRFFAERMKIVVEPTGCSGGGGRAPGYARLPGQACRHRAQRRQCGSGGAGGFPRLAEARLSPPQPADRRRCGESMMTAWVRLSTPSLCSTAETCALMVASDTPSS